MINLTEQDKERIFQVRHPREINLSCGNYYVKRVDKEINAFNELLGKKLADIFGLKSPNVYVINLGSEYYVLSENLRLEGFKTAIQLGITERKNYKVDACSFIDAGCFIDVLPNALEIMNSLIKMYIYDIMLLHDDRNLGNWGLIEQNNHYEVAIIDNENILKPFTPNAYQKFHANFEFRTLSIYDDFKLFLYEYGLKYLTVFANYFDYITPEYFESIVDSLDLENRFSLNVKQKAKAKYTEHYQKLKEIYEEFLGRNEKNAR